MLNLESISVVQFYLHEQRHIRLEEITGLIGANGSGKSALLDAVQIAMFGGNAKLTSLNAQADESSSNNRTIRGYCLGQQSSNIEDCVRGVANSYITLVFRDSETNMPTSLGVCIYASRDRDLHEVLGRYFLPGVELSMGDHLEGSGEKISPRDWSAFKQQLIHYGKVAGLGATPQEVEKNIFFQDSEHFIRAYLFGMRGTGNAPLYDSFKRAFRFALKMKFDRSIDEIVRYDVLESRPTNIRKFREVTESFRALSERVALIEQKIVDATAIETAFGNADKAFKRSATWKALALDAQHEQTVAAFDAAEVKKDEASLKHEEKKSALKEITEKRDFARNEASRFRSLKEAHASYADYALMEKNIRESGDAESRLLREIGEILFSIKRVLGNVAASGFLDLADKARIDDCAARINDMAGHIGDVTWHEANSVIEEAVRIASEAMNLFITEHGSVSEELRRLDGELQTAKLGLQRAKEGKMPLDRNVSDLIMELHDNGLSPVPVCDLVSITKKEWQPVIESFIGPNLQALIVPEHEESKAFKVYRSMNGHRAVYGAKVVMTSRQQIGRRYAEGTVAELIEGDNPVAVEFLRNLFGDTVRASSDDEAVHGKRTLTKDGMLVGKGLIDRLRPVRPADFRIGRTDGFGDEEITRHIGELEKSKGKNETKKTRLQGYLDALKPFSETLVTTVRAKWVEKKTAADNLASLSKSHEGSADAEYVDLGNKEREQEDLAKSLDVEVSEAAKQEGVAERDFQACENYVRTATAKMEATKAAAEAARGNEGYDKGFASAQWDVVLSKHGDNMIEVAGYCESRARDADKEREREVNIGSRLMGEFLQKHHEHASREELDDWRLGMAWIGRILKRLRDTELADYKEQLDDAYRVSQQTFRNDVALVLNQNIELLDHTIDRLNKVLASCPEFTNGERYKFIRHKRPKYEELLKFVTDIGRYGPQEDLLQGAGNIPELFNKLLEDKVATGSGADKSPLDDYREFYEFDIQIYRKDASGLEKKVDDLSKRNGSGSGGEHRSPLYVIAGAALASAYQLSDKRDGLRLIMLDEAFMKMDYKNTSASMRYLQDLGLQVLLASPGENLGTLTAFLHRYFEIMRDGSLTWVDEHDVDEDTRQLYRSDDPDLFPDLITQEIERERSARRGETVPA